MNEWKAREGKNGKEMGKGKGEKGREGEMRAEEEGG